ncbi:MAG: ABC transporter ATP-binding protein [Gaiellaceae bacterium]
MAAISYQELRKVFEGGTIAVDGIDLEIEDGELMVLVGPSGSGKTTVLRMTAGLEQPTSGEIRIGGRVVNDVPPKERNIAMVFQDYALYPHMTVYDNMAFGLKLHGVEKDLIRTRVESAGDMLGIRELLRRKPGQLSGGQRQRVAMGRAIVRDPDVFLMDEPLSNLDAKLRVEMRAYVAMLQQQLGTTTVYVTHDQTEAMTMGNRLAVMRDGRVQQCDAPQQLYDHPANAFVAGFIGSPAMNLFRSHLVGEDGSLYVALNGTRLRLPPALLPRHPHLQERAGSEVIVGIRPEDLEDAELVVHGEDAAVLDVTVALAEALGAELIIHFPLTAEPVMATVTSAPEAEEPSRMPALVGAGGEEARFTARLSPRSRARTGEPLRLVLDVERLHFFDPETGIAI